MLRTFCIAIYVSETWTITKEIEKKIDAFEMWTFRRKAKISWKEKKRNEEVCEIVGRRRNLMQTIRNRKMKFFGHVRRHTSILKCFVSLNICSFVDSLASLFSIMFGIFSSIVGGWFDFLLIYIGV